MKSINEIRLENLLHVLKIAGGPAQLHEKTGVSLGYISQIKNRSIQSKTGIPRNMGNSFARQIEKGMFLPIHWMDQEHPELRTSDDGENPVTQNGSSGVGLLHQIYKADLMFQCEFKAGEWVKPVDCPEPYSYVETMHPVGDGAFAVLHRGDGLGWIYTDQTVLIISHDKPSPTEHVIIVDEHGGWRLAIYTGDGAFGPLFADRANGLGIKPPENYSLLLVEQSVLSRKIKHSRG